MDVKTVPSNRTAITKNELLKMNQIDYQLKAEDFSKYSFRYYTTLSTAEKILGINNEKHYFYVSSLDAMNDIDEANMHSDKESIFALCFSNSNTESIPMWYLYSGLLGKGAAIRITPGLMLKFLRSVDVVYPVKANKPDLSNPLKVNEDFDFLSGWVYYFDRGLDPLYRNKRYRIIDDIDGFFENNYFLKKEPWSYEREFRLVFKFKSKLDFNKIAVPIDNTIYRNSYTKIVLAPEFSESTPISNISEFYKIECSDLHISMQLLKRNRDEIYEYIKCAIDNYYQPRMEEN